MIKSTLINLNLSGLNYYPFMPSLGKRNGSCDAVDDLFTKMYVPSVIKGVNVRVFNMIKNK